MNIVLIDSIISIVKEASALMKREGFSVKEKGSIENIVTSSDLAVQEFLTGRLAGLLPGSGFLCEEENLQDLGHEYVWIIDPIDGTANYARGSENCCISVALVRNWTPVLGVVYSPWRDELYSAEAGKGAFCNGRSIHVSSRPFERGFLFTAMSTYRKEFAKTCSDIIYDLYMECNDFRRTGSAAVELCLMARGFAELYFEMRLLPWDYAAAALVLKEAGGFICDLDGNFPSLKKASLVIAANSQTSMERILDTVRRHLPSLPEAI